MKSRSTPSTLTPIVRRRLSPLIEPLENRQLLSLVVDLRMPGGAKTASVGSVGQVLNLEIWATVKGNNSTGGDEGLQIVTGSLLSTNVNGGAANGDLSAKAASPFSALGSQSGGSSDLDGDGDKDVGTNDVSLTNLLFAARSGSITEDGGTISGATHSWKVGTATFKVTSLKSGGTTNLVFRPGAYNLAGIWREDGSNTPKAPLDGGVFQSGAPLVLTRGSGTTTGSISGRAFKDANKNNTFDTGDTGIASAKFFIDANKNGALDAGEKTTLADSAGNFIFTGLTAGSYRVREVVPSGLKITSPSIGYYDVTLTTGLNVSGKNFANQSTTVATTGTITGKVFTDTNGDGAQGTGEANRSGVTVYLDKNKNGIKDSTEPSKVTNSAGVYTFTGIANGSYRVRIQTPTGGYRITTPTAGYYDLSVAGNTVSGKNFGVTQRVQISGRLWVDTDKDGIKDTNEAALNAWRVYIDKNKNGKFDSGEVSVLTDSSGNYTLKGLVAGSYRVAVVQPSGYTRLSAAFYDVTLANGQTSTNKNFRYKKP